jgi:GT2 family glycosyltransferase
MNSRVAIIILNWNGWKDTIECLESVYQNNYPNFNVIIIDNGSTDDSINKIKEYCKGKLKINSPFFTYNSTNKPINYSEQQPNTKKPKNHSNKDLILIKNPKNTGFAEGNNIGINYAINFIHCDYVMLLNNDTVVEKDFLIELIKVSSKDHKIGIVGPKIYYYGDPNRIWFAKGKISWKFSRGLNKGYNELDYGQYNEISEMEYASGCGFLIKRNVIDNIGLIDPNFFMYFEEIDWTLRCLKKGYISVFVPTSQIWHKVSKSGGGIKGKIGLYYITRNRWLFMKKWANKTDFTFFILYQMVGALVLPLLISAYYRKFELFSAYYRGLYNGVITAFKDY